MAIGHADLFGYQMQSKMTLFSPNNFWNTKNTYVFKISSK